MTDEKKPKLNVVDLTRETDTDKIRAAVELALRQFPARLPVFEILAKERFAQFQAYKKEGFDDSQSLRLVIASIVSGATI